MRQNFDRSRKRIQYIINDRIQGNEFRLIDETGKQIGVVSREEAFAHAEKEGVDLVLVAGSIQPPVVKAIDVFKYQYQEEKKAKDGNKGKKKSQTKDIQLSLFISPHDLERLTKKASEFLEDGNQVRIRLPLFGRELGKKDMAFEKISQFIALQEHVDVASPPKMQGKVLVAVISRKK